MAPDDASKKSGKDLSNPSKWVSRGANDRALWGEAQGSGSKPYQTQIDLSSIAFKCSCPSRKFPCKHGLGLLLLFSRQKNSFSNTDQPSWVTEWLDKRSEKQEKQATKAEKPVDEQAQAKRQLARQQKVADGIEEISIWISDIVRNGILSMPEKGFAWFENMAKRMVDAQAPGLANMIRDLSETNFYEEGWQTHFLDRLLLIYLVINGFKNIDSLDQSLQQDIKASIGFTVNQEELKEKPGIIDNWLVISKQMTDVDNISTEKTWMYGTNSQQYALILQFIVRGQGAIYSFTPGMVVQAELVFFPSVLPMRALVKRQIATSQAVEFKGHANWNEVLEIESEASSRLPFIIEKPFLLRQLKVVNYNDSWWLQDSSNSMMKMRNEQKIIWKLLSITAGNAIDMAVLGRQGAYEPLGIWQQNQYIAL